MAARPLETGEQSERLRPCCCEGSRQTRGGEPRGQRGRPSARRRTSGRTRDSCPLSLVGPGQPQGPLVLAERRGCSDSTGSWPVTMFGADDRPYSLRACHPPHMFSLLCYFIYFIFWSTAISRRPADRWTTWFRSGPAVFMTMARRQTRQGFWPFCLRRSTSMELQTESALTQQHNTCSLWRAQHIIQ